MRVKFKQAVHIGGKDYSRGEHEVPEAHLKDKFFHKLIKAGLVEDAEATKVVAATSLQDRQKQLAEKLLAPKLPAEKPVLGPQDGDEGGDETPPSPPADEEESSEEEEHEDHEESESEEGDDEASDESESEESEEPSDPSKEKPKKKQKHKKNRR